MAKKIEKIKEKWNEVNMSHANIDSTMEKMGHFTFKMTNSNSTPGGLVADKIDLDGYVCMSNSMIGHEYDIMQNPGGNAKMLKRILSVIKGAENSEFEAVSQIDVDYIKTKIDSINKNSLNLNTQNKRLKNIIIQRKNGNNIENKELVILRSPAFSKVLNDCLREEKNIRFENSGTPDDFYSRKIGKMSFGGSKPINVAVNAYSITPLYFEAPSSKNKDQQFRTAYFLHKNGISLPKLISDDLLFDYSEYLKQSDIKLRKNLNFRQKEEKIIFEILSLIQRDVRSCLAILTKNQQSLPGNDLFDPNLNKNKKIAFSFIKKDLIKSNEDENFLIEIILSSLKTKSFKDKNSNKMTNLFLDNDDTIRIKNLIKDFIWQNIF